MSSHYLRKYGAATILDFQLYKLDGTGLKVDAASATHDIKIMKDEGAEADTTADAFVDEGQGYSLALTATEMEAARIAIYIVDLSAPQVWLDKVLIIETYGHASAQISEGLEIQTEVNKIGTVVNTGGTATLGAVLGDMANSAIVTRLGNAQTELNKIGTITNTGGTASIGAVLGDPANVALATREANLKTQTDKLNFTGNYIQAQVKGQDDIDFGATQKASITAAVPSVANILAGVIEGTLTIKQALQLTVSGLAGKLSGGGTATLKFRDTTDAKDRLTVTVDANNNRTAVTTDLT